MRDRDGCRMKNGSDANEKIEAVFGVSAGG